MFFFFTIQKRKKNLQHEIYQMCFYQDLDSSYYSDYVKSLLKKRSSNCR